MTIPDNVIELERRRSEHRERDQTVSRMQERIVELERENADLRRQLARSMPVQLDTPGFASTSFPHGP